MNEHRFLSAADKEMVEAALYYERNSPGVGQNFLSDVQHVIEGICKFPDIGTPLTTRVRSMLLPRYPYALIYHKTSDSIVIVAVAPLGLLESPALNSKRPSKQPS